MTGFTHIFVPLVARGELHAVTAEPKIDQNAVKLANRFRKADTNRSRK